MNPVDADDIVETVRSSLLVLDADLCVLSANRAFFRTFQVNPGETIGRPLFELGNGQRIVYFFSFHQNYVALEKSLLL